MISEDPATTPQKILTAAESLFAQYGYAGVSLRQITATAKVNLAAVNYHFYDKESLYLEILRERLKQVNRRRLDLLSESEARSGSAPISLASIIDALARPFFLPHSEISPEGRRLLGRLLSERQPFVDELIRTEFHPVMTRFGQALRRHDPGLSPGDFLWRLSFVIGAMHHAVVTMPDMPQHTGGLCRATDGDVALANFTAFAVKALSI